MSRTGFTVPELLVTLVIVGTVAGFGVSGYLRARDAQAIQGSVRQVREQLALARRAAVGRREVIRFSSSGDELLLETQDGEVLGALSLAGPNRLPVDSVRLRPATFRFNARGQAAPGSVYLYRGDRAVRIVCNFLGRLRVESVGGQG